MAEVDTFEQAVVRLNSRPIVILGSSLSPDGRYGVALIVLPTANYYVLNNIYERTAEGWKPYAESNGDLQYHALGDDLRGVLSLGGQAPPTTRTARIAYEGSEYSVPVRDGHFFFVAWDTEYHDEPRVVGFD